MKKIEAVIRKSKFESVVKALRDEEILFFSYWDITGSGHEQEKLVYRGIKYETNEIPRVMLSIVVSDTFVQPAIDAILDSASTGVMGDGKIFVSKIEQVYRIRNQQQGQDALQ